MEPEALVDTLDLSYLTDVLTRDEAVALLRSWRPTRDERVARLAADGGYPCYTTSAGWLGYDDEKLRRLLRQAVDDGYTSFKLKVGANLEDDVRRLGIAREVVGDDAMLMIDANQVWDVPVCPHAGGVGLCELVQHLSIVDYVAISGSLEGRVTEYVDHLHEHFVDPCVVAGGRYRLPSEPGYSARMHDSSVEEYAFPDGTYWAGRAQGDPR